MPGGPLGRGCRMWFHRNIVRLILSICLITALAPASARGEPISPLLASEAYILAEQWVNRAAVPEATAEIKVTDLAAIHATLRLDGITLGQATAANTSALTPAKAAIDMAPLLIAAVRDALADARAQLAVIAGQPNAPKLTGRLEEIAPLLVLDLQFAMPLERVRVKESRELAGQFIPALHGIAATREGNWAWIFPATAQAANLSLPTQITRLLTKLSLSPDQLLTAAQPDGLPLYRFEVLHLTRAHLDAPAQLFHRGRPAGPLAAPSLQDIELQSHRWADYLVSRMDESGHFKGTYLPTADRYQPDQADPADAALACLALSRYCQLEPADSPRSKALGPVIRLALLAAAKEAALLPDEPDGPVPDASLVDCAHAASIALAILAAPGMEDQKDLRDRCASALLAAQTAQGAFRDRPHPQASLAARPTHALICYALVDLYDRTRDLRFLDAARRGLVSLWKNTPQQRALGAMPWAALAELGLLNRGHASPGLLTISQCCDALLKLQVQSPTHTDSASPAGPNYISPDTVGGFILDTSIIAEPTWQSAAMLLALAAALPVESFVPPQQRPRWIVDGTAGLGFLHRLSLDDSTMWAVHQPLRARHGVRTALWDNRQPLAATAMALLASTQWQQTLRQLQARGN